ncbi:MAG: branched-chain amino acid transport system permease protein [Verrucomicrobiales bacterium]|jgi:branched-chain amino acid transport system permease protein
MGVVIGDDEVAEDVKVVNTVRRDRLRVLLGTLAVGIPLIAWTLTQMSTLAFFTQILNGLSFGALLFFLAAGFTMIFGLLRIANLAHGGFYLMGGYVGVVTTTATGQFWLGLLAGGIVIAFVGLFTERVLLRRIRGLEKPEVLLTIGMTFVIGDLSLWAWGGDPRVVDKPDYLKGAFQIGDSFFYPKFRIFVLGFAIILALVLFYIDRRTKIGAIVRAGVDDRETVAALGINIKAVFTGAFMFGAFIAGMSGVIGAGFLVLLPGQDFEILLFALVVVIIGGLGSLEGAALGAVVVGLIDAFAKALIPDLSFFTLFAPMAIILMVRPNGLLGRAL